MQEFFDLASKDENLSLLKELDENLLNIEKLVKKK